MNDPGPDSEIDLQYTYEPSPEPPARSKGFLRKFVMPIGCAGAGLLTGNPFWYALATTGFLLNLLPISPLDGGRIIGVISPKLWIVGLIGAVGLFYPTWSPIVALIIIMGSFQVYASSKSSAAEKARYYAVSPGKRTSSFADSKE